MQKLVLILHVLTCIGLIALILVQHSSGADVGISLSSGSANSLLGSKGSASFFVKLTAVLAMIFFATSLTLSYMAKQTDAHLSHLAQALSQPSATP